MGVDVPETEALSAAGIVKSNNIGASLLDGDKEGSEMLVDTPVDADEEEELRNAHASFKAFDTKITSAKTGWKSWTPFRQTIFLYKLFFSRQFIVHRVVGLSFLLQYIACFYLYLSNYERFKKSALIWTLPLTGLFQSINAVYTFTFLPKKQKDGGYFGDKSIMSYPFIIENSFFALILFFQWIYYDDTLVKLISQTVLIEQVFVFFPYILRTRWPKTSFRDALDNKRNRTEKKNFFFMCAILVTKAFYIWAKHYIGYFLNYARFLDRVNDNEKYYVSNVHIFSSFATTISIFLQTLKFKRYIGSRTSFIIYFLSYMGTFYGFASIWPTFFRNLDLTLITLGGLIVNFGSWELQWGYQIAVMMLLNASRSGLDMGNFLGKPFLYVGKSA